jgi:hypothetical protein
MEARREGRKTKQNKMIYEASAKFYGIHGKMSFLYHFILMSLLVKAFVMHMASTFT